jgi:hypothetical protein
MEGLDRTADARTPGAFCFTVRHPGTITMPSFLPCLLIAHKGGRHVGSLGVLRSLAVTA